MRAGVLMVAAMVFAIPAWAAGQGESSGTSAHVTQGAVVAQPSAASTATRTHSAHPASHGGHAPKGRGAHGGAASHARGRARHAHSAAPVHASSAHAKPKAKSSHKAARAGTQRHAPQETQAAHRPQPPASAAMSTPRSVTQKRPAPKPAAVRPGQRHRLIVNVPPPAVHRAIPAPHELPPILS